MHQQGEGREHGGHQDGGEACLHAGQDRNARRDEANICGRVGLFATGSWSALFRFVAWCVCGAFLLRAVGDLKMFGLFKTVHGTPFAYWDTRLYSPLCFVLSVLAGTVASGPG